jgi:anti-sigma factor RsiW
MKTETLEALLIDRALGALSPEIAELLENYLIENPAAARQANSLLSTVYLARTAVATPSPLKNRVPPLNRVRRALAVQSSRNFVWQMSKLAACVALGLTIGLAGRFGGRSDGTPNTAAVPVRPAAGSFEPPAMAGRNGFWSLANFAPDKAVHATAAAGLNSRYRLHWDSPVKEPHLEGNL